MSKILKRGATEYSASYSTSCSTSTSTSYYPSSTSYSSSEDKCLEPSSMMLSPRSPRSWTKSVRPFDLSVSPLLVTDTRSTQPLLSRSPRKFCALSLRMLWTSSPVPSRMSRNFPSTIFSRALLALFWIVIASPNSSLPSLGCVHTSASSGPR